MKYDVVIIGGGASGIVAAIEAKKQYENVAIIEKESRIGKKILATGNGKCNMTNIGAKITEIIDKFLGKGKKVTEATREQAEIIYLIINEIKEELM